jgi:hypothetical protein
VLKSFWRRKVRLDFVLGFCEIFARKMVKNLKRKREAEEPALKKDGSDGEPPPKKFVSFIDIFLIG